MLQNFKHIKPRVLQLKTHLHIGIYLKKIKNQQDLFKKYDKLNLDDYYDLYKYCNKKNIDFLSTPFD